jgi:hypothetical protein
MERLPFPHNRTYHTPEGRERIKQARLGKRWSEEVKQKIRKAHLGKLVTVVMPGRSGAASGSSEGKE